MRTFLNQLSRLENNSLKIINDEVEIDYDITAYYLLSKKENPALLFRNIKNYKDFSIVTNLLGSEERVAMATGYSSIAEFYRNWNNVLSKDETFSYGVLETNPPVKEVIYKRNEIDILTLPITRHYKSDGSRSGFGRYITSGLVVARDPRSEDVLNLSFTRIQPFDRDKYSFDAGSHGNMWEYLDYCKKNDISLEMSVIIGAHPVFYLLGAAFTKNEYAKANHIINFSYTSGFSNNLPVPSDSEMVIEAVCYPDETYEEGPFAEYTGYMGQDSTRNVAHVKSIMSRKNPIYYDIQPSNSAEHINLFSLSRSASIINSLERFMPKGPKYNVVWPHYGSRFLTLGCVDNANEAITKQFGLGIIGTESLWSKIVFMNIGRTDLNLERCLINLAETDILNDNNVMLFKNMFIISSDITSDKNRTVGKILFITSGSNAEISKNFDNDAAEITCGDSKVVISYKKQSYGNVNIQMAEDVDLSKPDEIGWALATRVNPQFDIKVESYKIFVKVNRKHPEIPTIPNYIIDNVRKKIK